MRSTRQIGRYIIHEQIGRGSMGIVARAYDPQMGRDVAIKILHTRYSKDEQIRKRFLREAQVLARLEHPNIVPIYDSGEDGRFVYLVMRLMEGGSLDQRIKQSALDFDFIAKVIERISAALDTAHQNKAIHRDVKPENILFDQYDQPYLADFGIVKAFENQTQLTTDGLIGTPAYMSPEQIQGMNTLDGRSDLYSLGIVLFEMLTGQVPYHADTAMGTAMQHLTEAIPRLKRISNVSRSWQKVIDKSMAKQPNQRYEDGLAFTAAVRQAAQEHSAQRSPIMLAFGGALLAMLLIGGILFMLQDKFMPQDEPPSTNPVAQLATEQAANFQMTLDAALAANNGQEGEVDPETQALLDAATREAQTAADAIVAAGNADNSIPTATTAAANSDGTTACSEGDFLFEIGDYVLTPARGTLIEEVAGPMTVAYPISVTSDCVLGNMMLKSLKTNQRLTPQLLDANGNEVAQLAGNSSGTIIVNFENSQDAITVDEEWVLEVRDRDGFSISLDAQPHLTLFIDGQIETWLVDSGAKSPTDTPEPTPPADNSVAQPQPNAQTQNSDNTNQQPNVDATRTRQAAEANYAATQTQEAINVANFNAQQTRQAAEAANAQAATAQAQATQTQTAARATYNAEQTRVGQPIATATPTTSPPIVVCDSSDPAGDADGDGKLNQEENTIPGLDPCDPDSDDDEFPDNGDLCPTVPGPNTGCPGGGGDDDNEAPSTPVGAQPTLVPPPSPLPPDS